MQLRPLKIHKDYGVLELPVEVLSIRPSSRKFKKYEIVVSYGDAQKSLHFGDKRYEQFHDRTPDGTYERQDHGDEDRRRSYLARSSKIRNKNGELTCNDPFSPNRYSILLLW